MLPGGHDGYASRFGLDHPPATTSRDRTIRLATPNDAALFARCGAASWDLAHPCDPSDDAYRARLHAYFASAFRDSTVRGLVAETNLEPVGVVTWTLEERPPEKHQCGVIAYVADLFVMEAARRRGHARALMHAVIERGRAEGVRRLLLRATPASLPLYESLGFTPLRTHTRVLPDP